MGGESSHGTKELICLDHTHTPPNLFTQCSLASSLWGQAPLKKQQMNSVLHVGKHTCSRLVLGYHPDHGGASHYDQVLLTSTLKKKAWCFIPLSWSNYVVSVCDCVSFVCVGTTKVTVAEPAVKSS